MVVAVRWPSVHAWLPRSSWPDTSSCAYYACGRIACALFPFVMVDCPVVGSPTFLFGTVCLAGCYLRARQKSTLISPQLSIAVMFVVQQPPGLAFSVCKKTCADALLHVQRFCLAPPLVTPTARRMHSAHRFKEETERKRQLFQLNHHGFM